MEHDGRDERRQLTSFFKNPANLRYNLNTVVPIVIFLTTILSATVIGHVPGTSHARALWIGIIALFSASCSFLVLMAMTQPLKALMEKAERLIKFEESRGKKGQMIEVYQLIERLMEYAGERKADSDGPDKSIITDIEKLDYIIPLGYMSLMVAHEVRNPLSTITGMTELLREKVVDSTQRAYLGTILDAAKKIDLFTNELLDFTDDDLLKESFDVNEMVMEVVNAMKTEFPSVECEFMKADVLPYTGDRHKIQQSIHNIARNAFQFENMVLNSGFVKIETSCPGALVVRVYNRNSIVDKEDGKNMFKPFFSKKKGGRGLGLFISAKNVDMHGGKIEMESGNEGTTFTIELPLLPPPRPIRHE